MAVRYELGINAAALDAIDMHVHLEVDGHGHESLPPILTEASASISSPRTAPHPWTGSRRCTGS